MTKFKNNKELDFFSLYDRFISDSVSGKRLQPNGKRLSAGSIKNYGSTKLLLENYCASSTTNLRIRPIRYLNKKGMEREKNYWKKFYRRFTDYLYISCKHYDNYVGQNIKNIKAFFNYLNKELALGVGEFHKQFYVYKEEIAIFPLMPEELNFLIYDRIFEEGLSLRMKEVKDFFVFGCTVALRVSDLLRLKASNLRAVGGIYYLSVRSKKTDTASLIKLPDYAVAIISKYKKHGSILLPHFNITNLNEYIKELLQLAGMVQEVSLIRYRRGKAIALKKKDNKIAKAFRFCDVATTHTMRRTAITTMLSLGMPEQLVRRISGHAPNSKEFFRYVSWAQTYQDQETERMFEQLKNLSVPQVMQA